MRNKDVIRPRTITDIVPNPFLTPKTMTHISTSMDNLFFSFSQSWNKRQIKQGALFVCTSVQAMPNLLES